ncbi:glycoside hydrolase family 31 protein [Rhodohalobacter sp. 614A]|uniref:glycoside hydrolase family 31 protein n=1 Tax=Rhodohalobacter sp. 614A TaxID=2908649 RepID=UPI001F286DD6|nr:alpha-xylosidase [Rhodohalobacter sp. 614A]
MIHKLSPFLGVLLAFLCMNEASAQLQGTDILNEPTDIASDFADFTNTYYLAEELASFDPETANGTIKYNRYEYSTRMAFNNMLARLVPVEANEFPGTEYAASPELPFSLQFVSSRTIRLKATSGPQFANHESLMLVNGEAPDARDDWEYSAVEGGHQYKSEHGKVVITENPWHVYLYDEEGKLLTSTVHMSDVTNTFTPVLPFSYVRRASDYSRSMAAVMSLQPGEKIYGFGESFTQFDKRGEKVVLWVDDANGTQNETMYKPVPFYMSNRGYGVFMHHSTPISVDVGKYYNAVNSMMIGDDEADLFFFLGEPKDILDEYTELTGKASMPPLWSFGFWMSRITYFSEEDGRQVINQLRDLEIPADVLHFDTGWFGVDWRADYQFPEDRFPNPEQMIQDFKDRGFHISLWQLPYMTPKNELYNELIQNDLAIKDRKGNIPVEDAIIDFSNPDAVQWYQDKLEPLLEMGVGAIKVDFGEAAPENGLYHSGRTGWYEHNLYPLRYNKAVADITKDISGNGFIWARSTWAGSQRYPVHWGGDPATTISAMSATLRAGLSIGLTGFTFWSHDIGGFTTATPEDVYRRWTPFGMLTSHVRSHGNPPTEPWEYSDEFLEGFRKADNMRYRLMAYIYSQGKYSSDRGLPMLRALFVEYPDDPGSWLIDDQYLFGSDMLVAPLFENAEERDVYLPPGNWIDYQTGETYESGWHTIRAGEIPIVVLVKSGTVLPHIELAQSTKDMDWSNLELRVFSVDGEPATGKIYLPDSDEVQTVSVSSENGEWRLVDDPFDGNIDWEITSNQ